MDTAFEILVPRASVIENFQFREPKYEWQGEQYSQGPPESMFGPNFILRKSFTPAHVSAMLPGDLQEIDWQCISVLGEGLRIYQESLFGHESESLQGTLNGLIYSLLSVEPMWVVIFEPDYDRIDTVNEGGIEDVIKSITFSLADKKFGFVIWKRK